jgi:4-amino-4-deoxy-L-arabinose transferase-like glycosyltransferase
MSLLASSPPHIALLPTARVARSTSLARRLGSVFLLLLLCSMLFFYGMNAGELYQTESLRVIVATESLRSGNWIVPTLYGEPLLTKPPGMYVAIALASWPAGRVSAATARLPSALAATVIVLLFYGTFAKRLGRRAGLLAAALLPASVLWLQRAPSAEIDLVQLAWVSAALLCFLRALEIAESPELGRFVREWLWWQLALFCVAGGALTKWTAPAFFYLTVVPLLWWRGRLRYLCRPGHLLSVILAALPCCAWVLLAVHSTGWEMFLDAVKREALPRLSPAHHTRPYPWHEIVTFPVGFLAANLPWSAAALVTLSPRFARLWDERSRRLLQLLHCWTWPNLLFWSFVPGHHLRHAMPLQPGLAGLAAMAWLAWLDGRLRWPVPRLQPGRVFLTLIVLWLAVKVVFVQIIVPGRDVLRQPRRKGEQIAALVPTGETLYLFRLKDEGILFYYGRAARRLPGPAYLPAADEAAYYLLVESEYRQWAETRRVQMLLHLRDEQGEPIILVKVKPGES